MIRRLLLVGALALGACAADADGAITGTPVSVSSVVESATTTDAPDPANDPDDADDAAPTVDDDFVRLYRNEDSAPGLAYDVYVPNGIEDPAVVVWVHGGGWTSGSRADIHLLDVVDHGYALASVSYRFAPAVTHPEAVDDIVAAVEHLVADADRYGIDPDRVVIAGHSSGAHQAFLAALRPELDLRGVITTSVWAELTVDADDPLQQIYWGRSTFGADSAEAQVTRYLGCRPVECPDRALDASLTSHVDEVGVPVLLQHGDADRLVPLEESEKLHTALVAAGVDATLSVQPGVEHRAVLDDDVLDFLADVVGS